MHRTKKDKIKLHIKVFFSIAFLVGLTLLALEVPKFIYKSSDVRLVKNVTSSEYDVSSANVAMDEKMLSESMYSRDTMFIETSKTYSKDEITTYKNQLLGKLAVSVDSYWFKLFDKGMFGLASASLFTVVEVVHIVDDIVYTGEVGILTFSEKYDMEISGTIVFDLASKKILSVECYAYDYFDDEYYDEYYDEYDDELDYTIADTYEDGFKYYVTDYEKAFIFPEGYEEYHDGFTAIDRYWFSINPYSVIRPHFETDEFGTFVFSDYNPVYDKIEAIVNEQQSQIWQY